MTPENRKRIAATLVSLDRITTNLQQASERLPVLLARGEAWLGEDNLRRTRETLERVNEAARALPELARDAQQLVKEARSLVESVNQLSVEARGTTGSVRDDTLPRFNALAESVERSAQRVGRLALQLDRDPQSALFGRKPGRPGPGEPGFQ
jgi:phospholipid/cholesterol/gamma-HCH transport system substrate-binding protein